MVCEGVAECVDGSFGGCPSRVNSGGFSGGSRVSMELPFGLDLALRNTDDRLNGTPLPS